MENKKVVFILGAGFSKYAGAPLISEFFKSARDIYANNGEALENYEKDYFKTVLDYYKNLSPSRIKINFNIDNIENFFSILDMNLTYARESTHIKELTETRNALIYVILKTLDYYIDNQRISDYWGFIRNIFDRYNDYSFITFNYDLILERAFEMSSRKYDYCLDINYKPDLFVAKLLKLHGSANWIMCENCKKIKELKYKALNDLYNRKCPNCENFESPLLIPPTWNKRIVSEGLKNVWFNAFNELNEATYIVIIGYSLPDTDLYFRHFLTLALKDNLKLRKIIILDKNIQIEKKYMDFFDKDYYLSNVECRELYFSCHPIQLGD